MSKKYYLIGEATVIKYVPKVTTMEIEVEGDTREELEAAIQEVEWEDKETLVEQHMGAEWWEDKHGWWVVDSEQLELANLDSDELQFSWPDIDEAMAEEDE